MYGMIRVWEVSRLIEVDKSIGIITPWEYFWLKYEEVEYVIVIWEIPW